MKKVLPVLLLITFCSCKNAIDKTLSKESFNDDVKTIVKENAKDYTSEDFAEFRENASNKITAQFLGINKKEKVTYRSILDTVKAHRLKDVAEIAAYNAAIKAIKEKIRFKILAGKYGEEEFSKGYAIGYSYTDNDSKNIEAFEVDIKAYDKLDNQVFHGFVKYTTPIKTGVVNKDVKAFYLLTEDDAETLKNTPYEKLRFDFVPTKIAFENGTKLEAPKKPYALIKKED
jgi:hypothetical protein